MIDRSVYNLNLALFCKVQINNTAVKEVRWDPAPSGGLCASPPAPGRALMPRLDCTTTFQTAQFKQGESHPMCQNGEWLYKTKGQVLFSEPETSAIFLI